MLLKENEAEEHSVVQFLPGLLKIKAKPKASCTLYLGHVIY